MVVTMNNIVGGGDSWVCDNTGAPVVRTLTTGVNTVTFTCPNTDFAYEPYINSADGTARPKYTSITFSGTTCTIVTTSVTEAQMGGSGGTQCWIKLRVIK